MPAKEPVRPIISPTGYFSKPGLRAATGVIDAVGPTGPSGSSGPSGPSGAQGSSGASSPSGALGPSGVTGFGYSYLSCFYKSGAPSSTTGKVLATFIATYVLGGNRAYSTAYNTRNNLYDGVVNVRDVLDFVTIIGLGMGEAPDNNCTIVN
ncbi:hypothetical protein MMC21_005177 [Puttea exsequens]|nr:hypothetical protein [Puttea exsequens]